MSALANLIGLLLEKPPTEPEEIPKKIIAPPVEVNRDHVSTFVKVKMAEGHVVFLHPDNSTYPFCRFVLEEPIVDVKCYED